MVNSSAKLCRCDGRYEGCEHGPKCAAQAGATHSPFFCQPCDSRRLAHISEGFEDLRRSFGGAS